MRKLLVLVFGAVVVFVAVALRFSHFNHNTIGNLFARPPQVLDLKSVEENERDDSARGENGDNKNSDTVCTSAMKTASQALKRNLKHQCIHAIGKCALLEPTNPTIQFQLGELYSVCDEVDEGLIWLKRAFEQEPTNFQYAHYTMDMSFREGDVIGSIRVGEQYVEHVLGLKKGQWQQTLLDISYSPKEELQWLVDAGDEVLMIVRDLHRMYNKAVWLPATNASFRLLATLHEKDFQLMQSFADFSASVGLFNQSLDLVMNKLELEYGIEYPLVDAKQPVQEHGLVLLGATLDAFLINMARRLLIADNKDVLDLISGICGGEIVLDKYINTVYVTMEETAALVEQCFIHQKIVTNLIDAKGALLTEDVVSDFGFVPLHLFASVGMSRIVNLLIERKSPLDVTNSLGQTLIHSAVLRDHSALLAKLWKNDKVAESMKSQRDRFGRSVQDMICEHSWGNMDFAFPSSSRTSHSSNSAAKEYCEEYNDRRIQSRPYLLDMAMKRSGSTGSSVGGGWKIKRSITRQPKQCDIDVVDGAVFSVNDFLVDYLSLQKPVLIKNGLLEKHWDDVRKRWERNFFATNYGKLQFERTSIPYAASFGLEANLTTVSDFMDYMDEQHSADLDGFEDLDAPSYIFSSMSDSPSGFHDHVSQTGESLLHNDFKIPDCIGPSVSEIQTRTRQFYLGPAGSGAPMHVHSGAWNALVFGRKRWFMVPPSHSFYSIEHPRDFVEEVLPSLKSANSVLGCVQESGDVMFVPEMWSHAVINEAESIGFASEFAWGGSVFSIPPPQVDNEEDEVLWQ
eukprot:m.89550 g.89550  ORF g.89550 m.89550 type:complete len:796 (+) comp12296_c0_seq12:23-2410(+)